MFHRRRLGHVAYDADDGGGGVQVGEGGDGGGQGRGAEVGEDDRFHVQTATFGGHGVPQPGGRTGEDGDPVLEMCEVGHCGHRR